MSKTYLEEIPFVQIFFDESRNVRGDWEYETDPDPKFKPGKGSAGLYEDIEQNGLDTPLFVAKMDAETRKHVNAKFGTPGVEYLYRCIRGHRRGRVLTKLRAKHPGTPGKPGRFDLIRCQVYEGLTEADEISLMVDQIHAKTLSEWGLYLAIKRLSMTSLSEEAIGTKISKSRGYVQAKMRIIRSPQCVEDSYRAKMSGQPIVNLTEPNLVKLAQARKVDEDNGIHLDECPDGGPEFQAAWQTLIKEGYVKPTEPKPKTRQAILDMINVVKEPILASALRWCAGDNVDLSNAINQLETLRNATLRLNSILAAHPEMESIAVSATPAPAPAPAPAESTPETAPADEGTAPAPAESTPETAPAESTPETAPADEGTAPADPAPAPAESTPETAPADEGTAPAESFPAPAESFPAPAETAPIANEPFEIEPSDEETAPAESTPKTAPADEGTAPAESDPAPAPLSRKQRKQRNK